MLYTRTHVNKTSKNTLIKLNANRIVSHKINSLVRIYILDEKIKTISLLGQFKLTFSPCNPSGIIRHPTNYYNLKCNVLFPQTSPTHSYLSPHTHI